MATGNRLIDVAGTGLVNFIDMFTDPLRDLEFDEDPGEISEDIFNPDVTGQSLGQQSGLDLFITDAVENARKLFAPEPVGVKKEKDKGLGGTLTTAFSIFGGK